MQGNCLRKIDTIIKDCKEGDCPRILLNIPNNTYYLCNERFTLDKLFMRNDIFSINPIIYILYQWSIIIE